MKTVLKDIYDRPHTIFGKFDHIDRTEVINNLIKIR